MAVQFTTIHIPCFVGSPQSPDENLSFIEIESRLREKIRFNAAEIRQVIVDKLEVNLSVNLHRALVWLIPIKVRHMEGTWRPS